MIKYIKNIFKKKYKIDYTLFEEISMTLQDTMQMVKEAKDNFMHISDVKLGSIIENTLDNLKSIRSKMPDVEYDDI